uniref:Glycosyl transferase n=1 Tax=Thermosporothrix sp. COM3 TaxID=2490863 RepID=A0A455SWW8_9CHLR|nr:glycosyl transferase [Thermosporothrix sp. COM3]
MSRYLFFPFPLYSHMLPTLAVMEELLAHGEEVTCFLPEHFRQIIEATGARFRAYHFDLVEQEELQAIGPADGDKSIALFLSRMFRKSPEVIPPLLESIREEQGDCIVAECMFLWPRIAARILHLPTIGLCPTYAIPGAESGDRTHEQFKAKLYQQFKKQATEHSPLEDGLALLSRTYGLSIPELRSLQGTAEPLTIVFQPRAFRPDGDTFDERFLFVGPSFQRKRYSSTSFPLEQLNQHPLVYISLGTNFNNQLDFYRQCFLAFSGTEWQVVLSYGTRLDPALLPPSPSNFLLAPQVPQLEVLPRADVFISHGGMNSVMESLYYGVPLVVIPQTRQEEAAHRVRELELGIVLDKETLTADRLREATTRAAHDPDIHARASTMRQAIQEAGGPKRAAEAIIQFTNGSH